MQAAEKMELRDAILDAANGLLGRYGYHKMTVEDLAREVGIGKGTIYLHFPSKEEIVLSTIDRLVDRLTAKLRSIASGPGTVKERLQEALVTRVLYRFDHRHHDSQSMDEMLSALRSAFLARRARYFAEEGSILASLLMEGIRNGELEIDDLGATAHALVLATNALLPYSLSARELGQRKHVAEQATHLANLLVRGLAVNRPGARQGAADPKETPR